MRVTLSRLVKPLFFFYFDVHFIEEKLTKFNLPILLIYFRPLRLDVNVCVPLVFVRCWQLSTMIVLILFLNDFLLFSNSWWFFFWYFSDVLFDFQFIFRFMWFTMCKNQLRQRGNFVRVYFVQMFQMCLFISATQHNKCTIYILTML